MSNENQDVDLENNEGDEVIKSLPDDEPRKKALLTLAAQKGHFRTKYEQERQAFEEYKKTHPDKQPELPAPKVEEPKSDSTLTIKDFIALKQKGLTDQEVAVAVAKAEKLGVKVQDFVMDEELFNPFVENYRSRTKAEQATPVPSSGSATFNDKPLHELSQAEIQANWDVIKQKAVEAGKKQRTGM